MILTQKSGLFWERCDTKWGTGSISIWVCISTWNLLMKEWWFQSDAYVSWFLYRGCLSSSSVIAVWVKFKVTWWLFWESFSFNNWRGFTELLLWNYSALKQKPAIYPLKPWLVIIIQPRLPRNPAPASIPHPAQSLSTCLLFDYVAPFFYGSTRCDSWLLFCQLRRHDAVYNEVTSLHDFFALHCSVSCFPPSPPVSLYTPTSCHSEPGHLLFLLLPSLHQVMNLLCEAK